MALMRWYNTRVLSFTYLWICPFLCRYSSPSSTSRSIVAIVDSSRTPLLCSPFATMCLIISRTEPENRRHNFLKISKSFDIIQIHFRIKTHVNLLINLIVQEWKKQQKMRKYRSLKLVTYFQFQSKTKSSLLIFK